MQTNPSKFSRNRKVKCDEGRPGCKRCRIFGTVCEGYGAIKPPQRSIKLAPIRIRDLAPASHTFSNDHEYHCFQRYRNFTAGQMTNNRETALWNRVILQASESETSVRYATITLGALSLHSAPHEFIYQAYGKAINQLKNSTSVRNKLLCALLFMHIEAWHGERSTTVGQIHTGVLLMEKLSQLTISTTLSFKTPFIDEDIIEAWATMEMQGIALGGEFYGLAYHRRRLQYYNILSANVPKEFGTLKEASNMLTSIMLTAVHHRFCQLNPTGVSSEIELPSILMLGPCNNKSEWLKILQKFDQWERAAAPLLMKNAEENTQRKIIRLRLDYLTFFLWAASGAPERGMYCQRYTKELNETIELVKEIKKYTTLFFSCQSLFILPLTLVTWNYRHREFRMHALDAVTSLPDKKGLWQASIVGEVMQWLMKIEEEGLGDEEYVPEDGVANVFEIKGVANAGGKSKTSVKCKQNVKGSPGKSILKETIICL
ncbi:uncharacterized protein PAC_19412 [Phialocephala subalpina]|uniref:Zn(2)-C6 fungal-type domain-containing protein n=1 Tax=Phialocephala subalpina TaxID=576137 RepID=A0A1L7XWS4_9HELO|nr:uncharacterized protein PAC_19412 [Phialocephala subalpina]